jgi:type I restriction enzyme R subunit
MNNFRDKANFIWSIADLIRDAFRRSKYQDVILPFTVLRRIDCVLAPTKQKVLERNAQLKKKGLENRDPQLRKASGYAFFNTSLYDFEKLLADANYLLTSFVGLHDHTIAKKVQIMIDHFADHVAPRIESKAKAMIVTRSRLHALRYKLAVDRYLKEKQYPFKAVVAFSGTVNDAGIKYTEASMNGFPESQTAKTFKRDEYRFLVVAYKFQTGFDQPLLHTMYVDHKLGGVRAVQTLSRLNRVHLDKDETTVLDFANEADEIQKAFEPYYDRTVLKEGTDPNLLYDIETQLGKFHFYDQSEVDRFAEIFFNSKGTQDKLHAVLAPVVDRFSAASDEDKAEFRGYLTDFIRLYAFLSQVLPFGNPDLEKLYAFGKLLSRKLPVSREKLPVEIQENIDMESYRIQKTGRGQISLSRGTAKLEPMGPKSTYPPPSEEIESLSQIILDLNQRFGTDFAEEDKVFIEQLEEKLAADAALEATVRVNLT